MRAFFDTSAVVPLLLKETAHSSKAREAWEATATAWAWHWLAVETEAALIRRDAAPAAWRHWKRLAREFRWLDLRHAEYPHLSSFNRALGLRAADAAHLFLFAAVSEEVDELELVTFDTEMAAAANGLGLPVWSPRESDKRL